MLTLNGRDFMDPNAPITELPKLGDVEEWEIANFTPDAHPIHLHLTPIQLVNRQEFSVDPASPTTIYNPTLGLPPFTRFPLMPYTATPNYLFTQHLPGDLNYAPLAGGTATVATAPDLWETGWKDTLQMLPGTVTRFRGKFDLPGLYVWHCHILSHEENDMMRPFVVTTPAKSVTATLTRNGALLGSSEPAALAAPITITAQGKTGLIGAAISSPQDSNGFEYQFAVTDPGGVTTVIQPFISWMYPMLDSVIWTPPKTPGVYTIQVDAREASATAAGVSQAFSTTSYTLTASASSGATSTTPAGFYKAGASINVGVSFNQAINSTGLAIALNNGVVLNTGALAGVSSYSGSFTVATGQDTPAGQFLNISGITGTMTDAAGNATTNPAIPAGMNISNSVAITIDTTLPTLAITAPTAPFVNVANLTVTGTATDPVGIQGVTVNGAAATVGAGGAFNSSLTLLPGVNTITVVATDNAGNQTTATASAIFLTLPTLTLTSPVAAFVKVANQTVSGTATDLVGIQSVTVNGVAVTVGAGGAFSTPLSLIAGANTITVVATNTAAATTTVTKIVTLDMVAPVTTAAPQPGKYLASVTVALTANEVATIYYSTDGTIPAIGSPTIAIYTGPVVLSSPTRTSITLKYFAVDLAGNVEPVKSGIYYITISNLTARVTINGGRAYTKSVNATVSFSASNKAGLVAAYAISTDNVTYLPTVAINPAVKSFSASRVPVVLPAGDGPKNVYVRFTDSLGVVWPPVMAQIILDTTLPVVAVTPVAGSYPAGALSVALSAPNDPVGTIIYYTTNGTTPTTRSKKSTVPFTLTGVVGTSITVKFFAVDPAGNVGVVQSVIYSFI